MEAEPTSWHYLKPDQSRVGPLSSSELATLIMNGEINADTQIWTDAFGQEWKPVSATPEFADTLKALNTAGKKKLSVNRIHEEDTDNSTVSVSRGDVEFSSVDIEASRSGGKPTGHGRAAYIGAGCFFWIAMFHAFETVLFYVGVQSATVVRLGISDFIRDVPIAAYVPDEQTRLIVIIAMQALIFFVLSSFAVLGKKNVNLMFALGLLAYVADTGYWLIQETIDWHPIAFHGIMMIGLTIGLIGSLAHTAKQKSAAAGRA